MVALFIMEEIKFQFTIHKLQNLASGGYRLAMDIPSIHAKEAAMLLVHADMPGILGSAEITLQKEEKSQEIGDDYGL